MSFEENRLEDVARQHFRESQRHQRRKIFESLAENHKTPRCFACGKPSCKWCERMEMGLPRAELAQKFKSSEIGPT